MNFDVEKIRGDFPILSQTVNGRPLVYFDNAATAQKPECVIEAVSEFYRRDNANIHRSAHELSRRATCAYEDARKTAAEFFGVPEDFECVFTRGATESLNIVAQCWGAANLKPGDEILLTQMEHHANIVPWQIAALRTGAKVVVANLLPDGSLDMDDLAAKAGERTKIISATHASNVLGTVNDVAKIAQIAKSVGAKFCVDAAQSAPHFLDDISKSGCDFAAISSHKCCGADGSGLLIGRRSILDSMPVWQGGGDMIENVSWEATTFRPSPERFEAGTPNISGAIGFAAAIKYLEKLDIPAAKAHEQKLLQALTARLENIGGIKIHGTAKHKVSLVSFSCAGVHPNDISTLMNAAGIAIRSGHHCAEPLASALGVSATCRASMAFYNTLEEVDYFAETLERAVKLLS